MLLMHILLSVIADPDSSGAEALVSAVVLWLVLAAEIMAAVFIGIGLILTIAKFIRNVARPNFEKYEQSRLTLARFLALALEFQLAADVLATAVAPTWDQLGKLAAIAVIRTALNYFLGREIKEEEEETGVVEPAKSQA